MKKILFAIVLSSQFANAQVDKYIKEKDVTRIIKTLSADDMMGRSATDAKSIFKAAAFIEKEFKKIGLTHMTGLTSYRQEFQKQRVSPGSIEVIIDGDKISKDNIIFISERKDVDLKTGLTIKTIPLDNSAPNKNQYFLGKAFEIYRDTSSCIVLVPAEFEANFKEFRGYVGKRFASGRKSTKVFVLGKSTATEYSVKATQNIESISMTNVVGVLEGKSKKEEMVVFSGHYDHIGIQKAVNGDSIANGADDDASGTTAVIELARYFKKTKTNERTLIFVAFTAEEIGGYGSKYFSQQINADKVTAMFNIEMIGKPSKWGQNSAFITGFDKSDFGEILQKNVTGTQFQFNPDPYPEQDLFYRSDNATLARLGVPAHSISTDQIDSDKLYHSVDDEFESMNIANITSTIKAIALGAKSMVEGKDAPKRIDKTAVR